MKNILLYNTNMKTQTKSTIGPHPELDGVVALDLAEVQHTDLSEAMSLACENGYWIEGREDTALGTTLHLTKFQ